MKSWSLLLALSLLTLGTGCRKSEVDEKPAAEVTATSTETAPSTTPDASAQPAGATASSSVIKEKSSIDFVAAKVTRDHKGKFANFDGTLAYIGGKPSGVSFDIDLTSIQTDTEKLTAHLKTADFFDVARYPKATFTSTSLTAAPAGSAGGTTHELRGTLDLHGVKKELTIPVKAEVTPEGVRATSEFTINRHDWGIDYKGMADDLIKDNVLIKLDLKFPPPPAA
jgi:polyisoprenoid-binding protein YceI